MTTEAHEWLREAVEVLSMQRTSAPSGRTMKDQLRTAKRMLAEKSPRDWEPEALHGLACWLLYEAMHSEGLTQACIEDMDTIRTAALSRFIEDRGRIDALEKAVTELKEK